MNIYTGEIISDVASDDRDQASVLVQLGLLEAKGLPIAGVETAKKVMDEQSIPSNGMIKGWDKQRK